MVNKLDKIIAGIISHVFLTLIKYFENKFIKIIYKAAYSLDNEE